MDRRQEVPDDHPGEQGFGFDRLGVRVPALLVISPYTERGTVTDQDFHTCSVRCARCASGSTWDRRRAGGCRRAAAAARLQPVRAP